MATVESLGHGSLQQLLRLQQQQHEPPSTSVLSLAAQTCTALMPIGRQPNIDASQAVQQLQAAPELADLYEWTQWGLACEPHLGSLRSFLQQHGMSS